jgi:hypothetical protein
VLNGSSAVLIGSGLYFIKRGREAGAQAHDAGRLRHIKLCSWFPTSTITWSCAPGSPTSGEKALREAALLHAPGLAHASWPRWSCHFILVTLARALKGSVRAPQEDRAVHLRHLDVRLGHRRGDLRDAVQDLHPLSGREFSCQQENATGVCRSHKDVSGDLSRSSYCGRATKPRLMGGVPKKPTRTPLSLIPFTMVVPTPSGSSIDVNWPLLIV